MSGSVSAVPRVSVIIPCYNYGRFLDEAVDSVLAQSLQDFEIIIVNDGSNDPETVRKLAGYERPKTLLINSENRGLAAARNLGIESARGNFILPLDADDKIGPRYLELACARMEGDSQLGIVYCQAEYFGKISGKFDLPPYSFPEILITPMIFCSGLFRREDWSAVGGYSSEFPYGWEDYDFWLSIIGLGRTVCQLNEVLFFYRKHEQSLSDNMNAERRAEAVRKFIVRHPKLYLDNLERIAVKKS